MEEEKQEDKKQEEYYITIPLKEYRKVCGKAAKFKDKYLKAQSDADARMKWYSDEAAKCLELQNKISELRANLDEAKAQISELLGLEGVTASADTK